MLGPYSLFQEQIDCSPRKKRLIFTWTNISMKQSKTGQPAIVSDVVKDKLDKFLYQNDRSTTLPGRNNQIYIGKDENGKSTFSSHSV